MAEQATDGRQRAANRSPHLARRVVLACVLAVVVVAPVAGVRVRSLRDGSVPASAVDTAPLDDPAAFTDGVVSVHGEDLAYDTARRRITVCDRERDGRPVKVEYETSDGAVHHLFDISDSRAACTALDVDQEITRHRVCEANLTWTCHNWQSTT